MPFDIEGARQAGYSEEEINSYLSNTPQSDSTGFLPPVQEAPLASIENTGGSLEALAAIASGIVAEPIAGLTGLASLPFGHDG